MTQEEKQLLLENICIRLIYGVKISKVVEDYISEPKTPKSINVNGCIVIENEPFDDGTPDIDYWHISEVRPYLRPLSSMTEEEEEEFNTIWEGGFSKALDLQIETDLKSIENFSFEGNYDNVRYLEIITAFNIIQWLLSKHFDLGLIEKGLALEAPEGMYK